MNIKMIAIDLDGTLLDHLKRVPDKNLTALRRCSEMGIEIVPATGRTVQGIPEEIKNLPGVRYAIATNGAVVADLLESRVIDSRRLPAERALEVMELAHKSADDIMYDAYLDGIGITMNSFLDHLERFVPDPGVQELVRRTRRSVPDSIGYIRAAGREVDKINLFFANMEARARMREELGKVEGIAVTSSIPNNLEINAAGADKGGAVRRLADYLHLEYGQTMAFGDGENDCTMMRDAGFGVAMENGEPEVLAAADYVTLTNDECGVAAAIEKFVLK